MTFIYSCGPSVPSDDDRGEDVDIYGPDYPPN